MGGLIITTGRDKTSARLTLDFFQDLQQHRRESDYRTILVNPFEIPLSTLGMEVSRKEPLYLTGFFNLLNFILIIMC